MSLLAWIAVGIASATYIGIALGRWPGLRVNRTTLTLIGAALLLACGAMTLKQAYAALDMDTLLLLFSMMIVNSNLFIAGFFKLVTNRVLQAAHTPRVLLAALIIASGVLSALFLNDTIVLMLTPLVLDITHALRRNPIPYLLGLATAANVGSVATITGNPQNMIVGAASGIQYAAFARALIPVALIGLCICWGVLVWLFADEFRCERMNIPDIARVRVSRPLVIKSVAVTVAMLLLFVAGVPVPLAAFGAAAVLLFTRRVKPERVLHGVDWNLLAFFAALFVVTGSLQATKVTDQLFVLLSPIAQAGLVPFGVATAVIANLVSNVPAVLLLQTVIPGFADPHRAWLMLAATATLAGNLTLLGSVANLIVAEIAHRWNVQLTFGIYLRAGVPITLLTLLVAFVLLSS